MGIRKGIFIGAAMLSIMACTACGNSGGNVSETNGAETSTGVESGIIEQPQVMYDGHIYYTMQPEEMRNCRKDTRSRER